MKFIGNDGWLTSDSWEWDFSILKKVAWSLTVTLTEGSLNWVGGCWCHWSIIKLIPFSVLKGTDIGIIVPSSLCSLVHQHCIEFIHVFTLMQVLLDKILISNLMLKFIYLFIHHLNILLIKFVWLTIRTGHCLLIWIVNVRRSLGFQWRRWVGSQGFNWAYHCCIRSIRDVQVDIKSNWVWDWSSFLNHLFNFLRHKFALLIFNSFETIKVIISIKYERKGYAVMYLDHLKSCPI